MSTAAAEYPEDTADPPAATAHTGVAPEDAPALCGRRDVRVRQHPTPLGHPGRHHCWYAVDRIDPDTDAMRAVLGFIACVTVPNPDYASWWTAGDAGTGVPIDATARHPGPVEALTAVLDARQANAAWFTPGRDGLTEWERQALQAEWYLHGYMTDHQGGKDYAVRVLFGTSVALYNQMLNRLLTGPRRKFAMAYDGGRGALVVYRLERRMARGRARRASYLYAGDPMNTGRGDALQPAARPSPRPGHTRTGGHADECDAA